jgi:hypothetical protein
MGLDGRRCLLEEGKTKDLMLEKCTVYVSLPERRLEPKVFSNPAPARSGAPYLLTYDGQ